MPPRFKSVIVLLLLVSCDKNETHDYSVCNSMLICNGSATGNYCTFGYKWGAGNPFPEAGDNKPGPSIGPVEITYSFHAGGHVFSTHSQKNLTSKSFDQMPECFKDTIRHAFSRWQEVAGITFLEEENDQESNIRIFVGDIMQAGVAFPPFPDKPCSDLAGQIALRFDPSRMCRNTYILALHEIGHALGLGHVQSDNVMNPDKAYLELQAGDILGVQSIYGEK